MDLGSIARTAVRWSKANSPLLLTAVAVGGVVTTAIFSARAHQEALLDYQDDYRSMEEGPKTQLEITKDYWHHYIVPVVSGALTITAIVAAHKVSVRRQAGIAAALALSEKTLTDYRDKVAEIVSQRKSDQAMEEVVQKQINDNVRPPWDSEVTKTDPQKHLCYDEYTGRWFTSNREEIERAVNAINHQINNDMYASLNDLYDRLGMGRTSAGDAMGWNSMKLLDVSFSSHLSPEGEPCLALLYLTRPVPNYHRN